jgi:hypothetical protein
MNRRSRLSWGAVARLVLMTAGSNRMLQANTEGGAGRGGALTHRTRQMAPMPRVQEPAGLPHQLLSAIADRTLDNPG